MPVLTITLTSIKHNINHLMRCSMNTVTLLIGRQLLLPLLSVQLHYLFLLPLDFKNMATATVAGGSGDAVPSSQSSTCPG